VLALFDQQASRKEMEVRQLWEVFGELLEKVKEPVAVLDEDFRIVLLNAAFKAEFRHEGKGELIYHVLHERVDENRLRELLEEKVPRDGRVDRYEIGKTNGEQAIRVSVRQVGAGGRPQAPTLVLTFFR
jgi:PAS domain-containing protein